ncbi:hypothetical protein JAAARDRAFT_38114 [Jaapia argillacea MUCL 33604]|uniref:Arf-GAP domain-containing protein n=1 Tax=Jaapia argillacea MUCL 33604 TaxID=933084 RepID=A0A067PUR1_9AGAM|nr:hypothetical protein JAAARDRAFT_38114 [Jaapia argillacea MUCL 33604]
MSRQDKATTERHAKTLRELLKKPENKVCADCKRNDPRWASWNIGVFLCIRCSGIHRSMGTHISRVKSVDLDIWTPEQMESIQKWGNTRANSYWEAHLKPGHTPPEHKMESFIRSKYESRRWALEGPPPADPSIFDNGAPAHASYSHSSTPSVSASPTPPPASTVQARSSFAENRRSVPPVTSRQPQPHQLLSTAMADRTQTSRVVPQSAPVPTPAQPPPQPQPTNDLFSLDFHAAPPSTSTSPPPKKDVKQDILSLFASSSQTPFSQAAPVPTQASPWDQLGGAPVQQRHQHQQAQPTSLVGNSGAGMWGVSSGWSAATPAAPTQSNLWGTPGPAQPAPPPQQSQQSLFTTSDVWGSSPNSGAAAQAGGDLFSTPFSTAAPVQKKDDVFGDLWSDFK